MRVLITCGPSSEPIDAVRRITNQSTGEIGNLLAGSFLREGHEVLCLRGEAATAPPPPADAETLLFLNNTALMNLLEERRGWADVVLHAAALADFLPSEIRDGNGEVLPCGQGKIPSDQETLHVILRRAPKCIARLRELFPAAFLVGWKYEVEGTRDRAMDRARTQIEVNGLDACVVNGPALGKSLVWISREGGIIRFRGKSALATATPGLCLPGGSQHFQRPRCIERKTYLHSDRTEIYGCQNLRMQKSRGYAKKITAKKITCPIEEAARK